MTKNVIREVKYVGFYNLPDSTHKRVAVLAATNKMDYICDALNRAGYNVHLVSPSWSDEVSVSSRFYPQSTIQLGNQKRLTLCPSVGTKTKFARNVKIALSLLWLFIWLSIHTKRNEKVLAYHSPWLSLPIRWAKRLRSFKLILEVEEIYSDVSIPHPYFIIFEKKLIYVAEAFLFATELLVKKIGCNRPYLIIYGAYSKFEKLASPPEDGKIHLVYAGLIDNYKAGAFNAIECARYLPSNYVLHLVGFGEIDKLNQRIREINKESTCRIVYDGIKSGYEYAKYVQSCHIGLSTHTMEGKYLETSFPSKILSYLALGLNVVSGKIPCVVGSQVHSFMIYYENDDPKSIAQAILQFNGALSNNAKEKIAQLDREFVSDIGALIRS